MTSRHDTIAPDHFLPLRRARARGLARFVVRRLVATRRLRALATLTLTEQRRGQTRTRVIGHGPLHADLTILDPAAYAALAWEGSRGLGRSYVNGLWTTTDLTSLVRFLFHASQPLRRLLDRVVARAPGVGALRRRPRSTHLRDRENIHAHYDLSNEFFALMLDETMAYSCGVFADETTTLFEAQVEKLDRVCRKLALGPGDHVIEIGTGWGGFALHAAGRYGARVTTTTISEEQRRLAQRRVDEAGLGHLITVLGEHYDDLTGTYDALVSIEMIEAVDWRSYDRFFAKCSSLLHERGRMVLQAITINDRSFERAKLQEDFIRDLVFPGGCLPSVQAITATLARSTDLRIIDLEDIGPHYARTLELWRAAVHAQHEAVRALGFDERFDRLWDMYLCYCEAAFLERHISDVQMVMVKPQAPPVAPSR